MTSNNLRLSASISDTGTINCALHADSEIRLENPVICFSLLDSPNVLAGGEKLEGLGGFCAIRLDGILSKDNPLEFKVGYPTRHGVKVMNRAWLPLGVYLRHGTGACEVIDTGPAGVQSTKGKTVNPDGDQLRLVPPPQKWQAAGGTHPVSGFYFDENPLFRDAFDAVDALAKRNNMPAFLDQNGTKIDLTIDSDVPKSGYTLSIKPSIIKIQASDRSGVFYAAISLLNLRCTYGGELPLGKITDSPRFGWRGQHLDCARHFYQPETILRLIDMMALLKLNVFHWHFADDEAFRLEIESYPELWQKSAFRGEDQTIPGVFGGGAGPTGGSYPLNMVRDLIKHAKQLEIDILPEIEIPAHALVLTRIYPQLRDPDDTGTEVSVQSYPQNSINPALPETWEFINRLSAEVAAIFPFAHLHVGGDELPPNTWGGSPLIKKMMGQTNHLENENDVLGDTMGKLAKGLALKNIRACAWEEAAKGKNGGIANNALLFSWSGQGPGLDAARRGYDVVMCPGQNVYFDMAYTDDVNDWGASWAGIISLADTVNWDPVPDAEPNLEVNIAGVEGAFWGEFTTKDVEMEAMLAPRILGSATIAWSPRGETDGPSIINLAAAYGVIFDTIGWDWNRGAISPV